jgi:hypothetical protein
VVLMLDEHNPVEVIWQQDEFIDHDRLKMTGNIDPAVRDDLANVVRHEYWRGSKGIRRTDAAKAPSLGSRPASAADGDEVRAGAPVIERTQPQWFS